MWEWMSPGANTLKTVLMLSKVKFRRTWHVFILGSGRFEDNIRVWCHSAQQRRSSDKQSWIVWTGRVHTVGLATGSNCHHFIQTSIGWQVKNAMYLPYLPFYMTKNITLVQSRPVEQSYPHSYWQYTHYWLWKKSQKISLSTRKLYTFSSKTKFYVQRESSSPPSCRGCDWKPVLEINGIHTAPVTDGNHTVLHNEDKIQQ